MKIDNALAGIAVKDFAKAKPWYERLLDQSSERLGKLIIFETKEEPTCWVKRKRSQPLR